MSTVPRPQISAWAPSPTRRVGRFGGSVSGTVSMCPAITTRRERPRCVRATIALPSRTTSRCASGRSAASIASARAFSSPLTDGTSHTARKSAVRSPSRSSRIAGGDDTVGVVWSEVWSGVSSLVTRRPYPDGSPSGRE